MICVVCVIFLYGCSHSKSVEQFVHIENYELRDYNLRPSSQSSFTNKASDYQELEEIYLYQTGVNYYYYEINDLDTNKYFFVYTEGVGLYPQRSCYVKCNISSENPILDWSIISIELYSYPGNNCNINDTQPEKYTCITDVPCKNNFVDTLLVSIQDERIITAFQNSVNTNYTATMSVTFEYVEIGLIVVRFQESSELVWAATAYLHDGKVYIGIRKPHPELSDFNYSEIIIPTELSKENFLN